MNPLLRLSLSAIFAFTVCPVHADDFTVGATIGAANRTSLRFSDGQNTHSVYSDSKVPFKLYGAYELDQNYSIEAGYKLFGNYTIDPEPGSGHTFTTRSRAAYIAAKREWHLGESWSLFGKAGVGRSTTRYTGTGELAPFTTTASKTGLYASVGAAWMVSKNVALTAEFEHLPATKTERFKFGMNGFALGARVSF
jgi:OmpA-OmpF porin, OOP family